MCGRERSGFGTTCALAVITANRLYVTTPYNLPPNSMSDQVQQIKERLDIVEVVGQYVKLTKSGKNYKGLSPFKKEKTPSFYVSPDKGMYYDFSTSQGGDIFSFVQTMEGIDFKGALTMLADRAGVTLVQESRESKDARDRLYAALEAACAYYETKLSEHTEALQYLTERGLNPLTIRRFRIGFAPDSWQHLRDHLEHKGYKVHELEQAGLVKKGERGSHYDRFRSRIMFPIMDPAGRVIAFSGRIFGEAAQDSANAKYLNSPETRLFDKGRVLYGYHLAKQDIRTSDCSILVEGQMDIVLSHQAGYTNTVAVSGTGLTNEHLTLLERLSTRLVLALDADSAGVASTGRAATLALARNMDVKVVHIPHGKDPADCIRESPPQWKEAVKHAQHIVDYMFDVVLAEHKARGHDERALVLAVRDRVLPYIARIRSGTDRAYFIRSVSQRLGLGEDAVRADVDAVAHEVVHGTHASEIAHTPSALPVQSVSQKSCTRREHAERALAAFVFMLEEEDTPTVTTESLRALASDCKVSLEPVLARHHTERETLALEAHLQYAEHGEQDEILRALLHAVAREQYLETRVRLTRDLRDAERERDDARAALILQELQDVARRIDAL